MALEYPQRYWWLVLIVVPLLVALISALPQIRLWLGTDSTVTEITLVPRQVTLQMGQSARLSAEARTSSGAVRPGVSLQWEAVDPSIVSVSQAGMLTALHEGQTEVLAKHERVTAIAHVTVTSASPAPASPAAETPAPVDRSREEILKLAAVGIESIRRVDLSFVQSHARFPFFAARHIAGTPETLNAYLGSGEAAVRRFVQVASLVKLTAHPVKDLRAKGWFSSLTSFVPIPIEDTDWAALIAVTFSQQPPQFSTWVVFFRSEDGAWKLLGYSGGEGLLE